MRRGITLAVAAGMVTVMLVALLLMSGHRTAKEMAIGDWADPVMLAPAPYMLFWGDTSDNGLYVYGIDSMMMSHDWGDTWAGPIGFNGRIDATTDTLYRLNMSGPLFMEDKVVFSKSTDDGNTWSDPVQVFQLSTGNDWAYGIFMLNDTLLAYTYDNSGMSDGLIMVSNSTDLGVTWSDPVVIATSVHVEDPMASDMVFIDDTLYMVYSNYTGGPADSRLMLAESHDMGAHWTSSLIAAGATDPLIKTNGTALFVTYIYTTLTDVEGVHYIKSSNGVDWSSPIMIGPFTDSSQDPVWYLSMAVSGSDIFCAYIDYHELPGTDEYNLKVNCSGDGGDTWEDLADATGRTSNAMLQLVLTGGGELHLFWVDMGASDNWMGGPYPTYYRSGTIVAEPPIAEFSPGFVVAMTAIMGVVVLLRRGRKK